MSIKQETDSDTKVRVKLPRMWKVVMHNDDFTPMDFVVQVLMRLFHKAFDEAHVIMMTVHTKGKAIAGVYTHEIAEQKCLEVKRVADHYQHPLRATSEQE